MSLIWCTADQMQKFNIWLRMPIVDIRLLQNLVKEHYEREELVGPGGDIQHVYSSFRHMLSELSRSGEDSGRFTLWYATLHFSGPFSDESPVIGTHSGAAALWVDTLERWARDNLLDLRFAMNNIDKEISTSYKRDVYMPVEALWIKVIGDKKVWRGSDKARSAWDNYLWDRYYHEIRTTPASLFFYEYRRMMHREWWRKVRYRISDKQKNELVSELLSDISKSDLPRQLHSVMSPDDAFEVDNFPIFDEVAN